MKITVANPSERFGAKTSIADIAQHSFLNLHSNRVSIYFLGGVLTIDTAAKREMLPDSRRRSA